MKKKIKYQERLPVYSFCNANKFEAWLVKRLNYYHNKKADAPTELQVKLGLQMATYKQILNELRNQSRLND